MVSATQFQGLYFCQWFFVWDLFLSLEGFSFVCGFFPLFIHYEHIFLYITEHT